MTTTSGAPIDLDLVGPPLRIAMVAPPWYELPPKGYGGIEAVCAVLVDALVARGHDVTLIGAGTRNRTRARFVSTLPRVQHERLGELMPAVLHAAQVQRALDGEEFDVVHDHTLCGPLVADTRRAPTVLTAHSLVTGEVGDYLAALGESVRLVAISDSQRASRSDLPWLGTVHNAIDTSRLRASAARPDGPVLWLGRFCPDKGTDLAIAACRAAGIPLVLAGKCSEPGERRYLDERIRPLLGPDVRLVCDPGRAAVRRLIRSARCLIVPIRWAEPFGMVMIEAMSEGRPVVALRRGAVPEIVQHGVTGWVCDHPDELPAALLRAGELDPQACVRQVRSRFSAELMARRYERVYRQAIRDAQVRPFGSAGRAATRLGSPARPDRTGRPWPASVG